MSRVWRRKVDRVAATLQTAACRGSVWSRGFSGEAAACGSAETPAPESVQALIRSAAVVLEHRLHDAQSARANRLHWRSRLQSLRADRDAASDELYASLVRLRGLAKAQLAESFVPKLIPPGRISTQPTEVLRLGRRVVRRLQGDAPVPLREPVVVTLDVDALAEDLCQQVSRLKQTLDEVAAGEAAAFRARVNRDRALARLVRTQSGVDRMFQAFSSLVDEPEA